MAEWHQVFLSGAGIVVIRKGFEDLKLIDHVTGVLDGLIAAERKNSGGKGDHFAAAGSNSRLWNAHEKLCMADPEAFVRYNANPIIPLISRSWLGPHYQITTQVNVVHPGGKAQICHRDYHMGFQTLDELAAYPAHVHWLSAALTLQGAIAHTDMPLETGPTKLLPFSQTYLPGYFATQLPEFRAYFEQNFAQASLAKGDLLFFNPAVFHAAGENKTKDVHRFANLMQIGSGYGRSIEIVDRARMSNHLYPTLAAMKDSLSQQEIDDVIAACAEGYPFPANLDIDSPLGGMAPESQQGLLRRALKEGWDTEHFRTALKARQERLRSH
jgi:ectoine hydroxylase-related dioxygenase (phytanoyl-CoA dioxygenase family)